MRWIRFVAMLCAVAVIVPETATDKVCPVAPELHPGNLHQRHEIRFALDPSRA